MNITDEAKTKLEELFESNGLDALKADLQQSCCGTALVFNLLKLKSDDKPVLINGVQVLMDKDSEERAKSVTIKVDNGELVINDEAASNC